jgi:PASTA domain
MTQGPPVGPPEGWQPPPQHPGWGPLGQQRPWQGPQATQPQWGAPPPPRPPRKGWSTGRIVAVSLLGIVVILFVIGALAGEPPTETSPQATAVPEPPSTQAAVTTPTTIATTTPTTVATTSAPTTTKQAMVRMPNVRNRILYKAMTELEDAGFNLDNVDMRWRLEDNGPPINPTNWAVVSQKPAAGSRVRAATNVTLNVIRTDTGF